jgi:hypothetical protein
VLGPPPTTPQSFRRDRHLLCFGGPFGGGSSSNAGPFERRRASIDTARRQPGNTLAAGFGLALLLGFLAARLGLPALLGYLMAGIVIGPATPGFVADAEIAAQLAEIGVMLLMFGVGLHAIGVLSAQLLPL